LKRENWQHLTKERRKVFPDEIIIDCDVNIHELDPFDILLRLILNAQRQPLLNQTHFWSVEIITPKEKEKNLKKV